MPDQLHFVASDAPEAQAALGQTARPLWRCGAGHASVIVALGGDGFMLQTLHSFLGQGVPIYGMNFGSVGFLMNEYREDDLPRAPRRGRARPCSSPADEGANARRAPPRRSPSTKCRCCARRARRRSCASFSTARPRLDELICDGILVSTPAGSTAYNLSAHGPILPIDSALLALTPVEPVPAAALARRPASAPGAIRFDILEPEKRPVSATADNLEVRDVTRVDVAEDRSTTMTMLFDAGHSLDERILAEQFLY